MLAYEIDHSQFEAVAAEFAASEKQIKLSDTRAARRTAGTIRKLAAAGLKTELGLRNASALRRRVKQFQFRRHSSGSVKIWVGANDLPISAFKGRPRATPTGVKFGDTEIHGAFIARIGGKRGVFKRVGRGAFPVSEVRLPVADRIMIYLEDQVFVDVGAIYFRNFAAEIRARTIYGVGK